MERVKSEDLLIVQCQKNMSIPNINDMHEWLCKMKASGVVVLPKDVSLYAVPRDVRIV